MSSTLTQRKRPRPKAGAAGTPSRRRSWAAPSELRSPIRSDIIKKGFERAPHRGLLRATGKIRDEADFQKPFIGISNSYVDLVPGHVHLQEFGKVVKEAVRDAGQRQYGGGVG